MKKLTLIISAVGISLSAEAANINKGNVEVGGSFKLSNTTSSYQGYGNSHPTYWSVSGNGQFFLLDHFSAGLEASFSGASHSGSFISFGPAATYYFLVKDNVAPFVMVVPLSWSKYSGTSTGDVSSTIRLGTKFFLTDSVAFGPALQYEWVHANRGRNDISTYSFLGMFSIHL